jgi:5-(carboxyamino)imidazole ribonucleotide synthase
MTAPHPVIAPGSAIGIIGGGQLGRMLAIAASEMGYETHIYCPEPGSPASSVATRTTVAAYDDMEALTRFAAQVAVVTYEFENIPAAPVAALARVTPVRPGADILSLSQHRLLEKQGINHLGIATAPYRAVSSLAELQAAADGIGLPAVLKTARMGYDGKGQAMLTEASDLPHEWQRLNTAEAILEGFVTFRMEISVIVARDLHGNTACYCPVQNTHKHHILSETIAPAPMSPELAAKAEAIARAIADGLQLVGLIAVEMFVTADDAIIVNELAPRPHNSGHWTIDACITSQFTQAIRAICGLPLGSPERLCDARMLNLIGDDIHEWPRYAAMPEATLHLYGKKEARPGRKMGHVTLLTPRQ